jgi:hypothetical protein
MLVLVPAAAIAGLVAPVFGLALEAPVIRGPSLAFGTLTLEDPYLLAGIPLYLGLWAIAPRPLRALPWGRLALGLLALEVVAGLTIALVGLSVARGWTMSKEREPIELVALVLVAATRVLPLPLWLALDPARVIPIGAARCAPGREHRS